MRLDGIGKRDDSIRGRGGGHQHRGWLALHPATGRGEHGAQLARGAIGEDTEGYRREFVSLVKLADTLTPKPKAAAQVSDIAH